MAHPHNEHRQHHVEHRRVAHITKGYASGGAVHEDAVEDAKMVKRMVKPKALRASGGPVKARMDRAPRRAKGGGVKRADGGATVVGRAKADTVPDDIEMFKKGPGRAKGGRVHKGKTTVNVLVGGHGAQPAPMPMAPPPMTAMPPRPPMPPPMAGPAPGLPPGMGAPPGGPPPGMSPGIRRQGGRTYATGGAVKDGPAYKEGIRNGTQVQHSDGKNDQAGLNRGKPITYKTGGRIEHVAGTGGMGPKLPGGGGGGEARLAKQSRARKGYAAPKGAHG